MRDLAVVLLTIAASLLVASPTYSQADNDNFLTSAIRQVEAKMVKVYGASAGRVEGYATGMIVSEDGQILTTQGVFLDGSRIRVVTSDGVSHDASIVRRDRLHQLALLQISAPTPEHFAVTANDVGEKGDWVIAICNAFKVAEKQEPLSATLGVVSLRTSLDARLNDRDVAYQGDLVLLDQITSNPGAAGGAVVTTDGHLVGLIGKIINSSETNTRINYAVPTSVLAAFINDDPMAPQITEVQLPPVELGIKIFAHGGRNSPAYIDSVKRGSPAFKARLKPDDLLISIAGQKIGNVKDYHAAKKMLRPNEETIIVVKRGAVLKRIAITPIEQD